MKFKSKALKITLTVLFVALCCLAPLLSVFLTGALLPSQFSLTWYGAFCDMYDNMHSAQGKRIIIVGNSNVAFGCDSALMEGLLKDGGLDYAVCNFGLYGSLGTKMMLDVAAGEAREGDILVLAPELGEQSLSTYFSAKEAWYAIDGDMSLFFAFDGTEQGALAGAYAAYAAEKYKYFSSGEPALPSGIYARDSFDENCDLKNCSREYNVMPGGSDANNPLSLDISLYSSGFVSYVNECDALLEEKGAELFLSFSPMNASAFAGEQDINGFQTAVTELFDCPVISYAGDYIMDEGWFYDNNFHLNSAGMAVRSVQLVNDIKNQLGNTTKTEADLPEMPVIPDESIEGEGNNADKNCFTYELSDGRYTVTGLTEEGRARTQLTIPYQVNGIYIDSFTAEVFAGNAVVQSVTIQNNISLLPDGAFSGCSSLREIRLEHAAPADISVGYGLFSGTSGALDVYVPEDALSAFANNYFWGRYADRLKAY